MIKLDALIIGAGAAGLMCAIEAGKRGRSVLVIDHANKPGKKILMSGGGRCNFTNLDVSHANFTSHNPHFCKSALKRYTSWDFIALVQKHQIPYHEKTLGQLFCDNKAKDIVNMLLTECDEAGAKVQLDTSILSIEKKSDEHFLVKTSAGDLDCESVVIATGGLSIPTMGATAFGYEVAKQFGIKVWPTSAGLVPFTLQNEEKEKYAELSGIALDCEVHCHDKSFREGMLFTHRGLSGPSLLQISSYWKPGDELQIKLLPSNPTNDSSSRGLTAGSSQEHDLFEILKAEQHSHPNSQIKNVLNKHFPKRVVTVFLGEALENKTLQSCSHKKLLEIADLFQNWTIKPNGTEGYRTAEVTLGGVDCDAISSKTFEANNVPGLYFIGETLDVTGWLGGYNFQWAWSSGFAAGQCV